MASTRSTRRPTATAAGRLAARARTPPRPGRTARPGRRPRHGRGRLAPTVDNYLGRVPKRRILEAVREAKGERSAQLIDHLKKAEMAKEAERLLDDTGWLPEPLRVADAVPTCSPAARPSARTKRCRQSPRRRRRECRRRPRRAAHDRRRMAPVSGAASAASLLLRSKEPSEPNIAKGRTRAFPGSPCRRSACPNGTFGQSALGRGGGNVSREVNAADSAGLSPRVHMRHLFSVNTDDFQLTELDVTRRHL